MDVDDVDDDVDDAITLCIFLFVSRKLLEDTVGVVRYDVDDDDDVDDDVDDDDDDDDEEFRLC